MSLTAGNQIPNTHSSLLQDAWHDHNDNQMSWIFHLGLCFIALSVFLPLVVKKSRTAT